MTTSTLKIERLTRDDVPAQYQEYQGCIAFQMVKFTWVFYGREMTETLDTKILANGDQIVIDGNGFIKGGTNIKGL